MVGVVGEGGNHPVDVAMKWWPISFVLYMCVRGLVLEHLDQYKSAMTTTWALCLLCLGHVHEES